MNQRMRQYVVSLAATGLLVGATNTHANSVSGEAFGVSVNVAEIKVGPTPHVVLPPDGGMVSDRLLRIAVPNVATSGTLEVVTTGSIGPSTATAQSSATVEGVNLLNGLVTARVVVAMSSSTANGSTATSTGEGSALIGFSINGSSPTDVTPSPNTSISLAAGITVILNEQIASGDGVHTSALTVNMIHVVFNDQLTGAITGDIVVSSAHSDVNFVPAPKAGNAFMTGGGKLGTGRDIATFGFNAGSRGGSGLHGQLQYTDHAAGLNVHSLSIDSFALISGTTCVTFSGGARVNNVDGYRFSVNQACDNGEPGVGHDTFDISVLDSSGVVVNSRSGTLTGGNLQLHPE
ncbi:MAG TPA: choice-of-anchor P family protein [Burkholderiales bacterium]|nr:choice-of-anchor P family protein [Burkholderiales bacterium]